MMHGQKNIKIRSKLMSYAIIRISKPLYTGVLISP